MPSGPLPVPGIYDTVRVLTEKERAAFRKLPWDEAKFRKEVGVLPSARFAIEKGRHALADPRAIPSKAFDYAKYDWGVDKVEVTKLLLSAGADRGMRDNAGKAAHQLAIERGASECARLVLPDQ